MVGKAKIRAGRRGESGFTLMELIIVMTIIGVLAAVAIPNYLKSVRMAKEAVLRENLQTMRTAIDSYTADKEKAPDRLDDVVQAGYLKKIPVDPITSREDTWVTGPSDSPVDPNNYGGIGQVHSASSEQSTDGTRYNSW